MITSGVEDFVSSLFEAQTFMLSGGLFLFVQFVNRLIYRIRSRSIIVVWRRILPLVPELIAVPAAVLGAIPIAEGQPVLGRIASGLWIAYIATKTHKFLGQTVLNDDAKIEAIMKQQDKTQPKRSE